MIRIGIISPSEIALRRFMPSLSKSNTFKYVGIAYSSAQEWFNNKLPFTPVEQVKAIKEREYSKAQEFQNHYGGKLVEGYETLIKSDDIDAIYLPLPPSLHYKWAKMALEAGKHVFVEKPSTCCYTETRELVEIAQSKGLALHENYMFVYHNQISIIDETIKQGKIGDVRIYRINFGFPRRPVGDFRYVKELGGGALFDAGGYTIKYARYLLGETARIICANKLNIDEFDVEIAGSATMINTDGICAQLAFGMDNDYKCSIEIWGSKGTIISDRILTAPDGFEPEYILKKNQEFSKHKLPSDDTFLKSINVFAECVNNNSVREAEYNILLTQSRLVSDFQELSK